ncbi:hypothetical protein HDC91_001281 [Mucilaginibacter sp. AK015]|nr:hypothetical protein [Mucilaginibacter sp. AK015]
MTELIQIVACDILSLEFFIYTTLEDNIV